MPSYSGTVERPDKAKAILAVVAVHAALALVILSGLNVRLVRRAVEEMTTISIKEPPPPPPVDRVKPAPKPQSIKKPQGEAAKKAKPAPVFARKPSPIPSPVPTSRVTGSQTATSSGTQGSGHGTGAGNAGTGTGGGGYADYSRFIPARLIENIPNSEYRRLASTGIPSGLVGVVIVVNSNGTVSNCRIARSSGDPSIDALVCELTLRYVRFEPARDPYGRAIAQDITYFPSWRRR